MNKYVCVLYAGMYVYIYTVLTYVPWLEEYSHLQ